MIKKKGNGIVYLERSSFSYFTDNGTTFTFTYPAASIKELDVIDEHLFTIEATNFLSSNKIAPQTVMIVLSADILYEKDFVFEIPNTTTKENQQKIKDVDKKSEETSPQNPPDNKVSVNVEAQPSPDSSPNPSDPITPNTNQGQVSMSAQERLAVMQTFIDVVPFDEIASKSYKIDKITKLVVTNKSLYEVMVRILNKLNFIVDSVVPITVIPKGILDTPVINQENSKKILRKFENVAVFSLLEENSFALSQAALSPHGITMSTKVSTKREYLLIGVFGLLILILGIVVYSTFLSPSKDRKIASEFRAVSPTVVILPTAIPTPVPVSTVSAQLSKEFLRIQITGGTTSQVNLLRQDFINNGYKNITPSPNNVPSAGRATVVFSSLLTTEIKDSILEQLRQSFLNVTAQEAEISDVDIIVNL